MLPLIRQYGRSVLTGGLSDMDKNKTKTDGASPVMRLYSTAQAATMWGISVKMVRKRVDTGELRPILGMGKGYKFDGSEFAGIEFKRL